MKRERERERKKGTNLIRISTRYAVVHHHRRLRHHHHHQRGSMAAADWSAGGRPIGASDRGDTNSSNTKRLDGAKRHRTSVDTLHFDGVATPTNRSAANRPSRPNLRLQVRVEPAQNDWDTRSRSSGWGRPTSPDASLRR